MSCKKIQLLKKKRTKQLFNKGIREAFFKSFFVQKKNRTQYK